MAAQRTPRGGATSAARSQRSLAEQLIARTLDPFGVVMLTRERIQETLEDAVQRGRVTRTDANELAGELLRRGRQQTEELLAELETRLARTADRARRSVGGLPLPGYDSLTARQVQGRLSGLTPAELRQLRDHERRHAHRKTVLEAIERALTGRARSD